MKKILIVSYYYSPANIMGAVRGSKLSKYLSKAGYDVSVICSKDNKLLFMPDEIKDDNILVQDTERIDKIKISHSTVYESLAHKLKYITKKINTKNNFNSSIDNQTKMKNQSIHILMKKALHFLLFSFSLIQDYDFLIQVKKRIKKRDLKEYDVVISSYGPIASHLVGKYIKKIHPECLWIADFRDPIAQPTNGKLEYKINKRLETSVCHLADQIIAVSKGYMDEIIGKIGSFSLKVGVITNGYDSDDLGFIEKTKEDKLFSFVYTGTTYGGRRDISPIFSVLNDLIKEGKVEKKLCIFRYAGSESHQIIKQADKYGLSDIVEAHKFLPRSQALELQANSKILVVSTWNENKHKGVLPGKFLEYMMFKKPIIAVVNGEVGNSEISQIVENYNLGVNYEAINHKEHYIKLKDYIYNQYMHFCKFGNTLYEANESKVNSHSYLNITEKFIKVIEDEK